MVSQVRLLEAKDSFSIKVSLRKQSVQRYLTVGKN